jgi:hypothetical protein
MTASGSGTLASMRGAAPYAIAANMVTWSSGRSPATRSAPNEILDSPAARFARLAGLRGIRVDRPKERARNLTEILPGR